MNPESPPYPAQGLTTLWEDYLPTSLKEFPHLARRMNVGRVFAKMENERPLGNFKALGGMFAALRALARVSGACEQAEPSLNNNRTSPVYADLRIDGASPNPVRPVSLPRLICASDGNHGLSVAAAAARVGAKATIYLPAAANPIRASRIKALGGEILWVTGTYDDAVTAAAAAAVRAEGLLIPDTSEDPTHPVVKDVMAGYGLLTRELVAQFRDQLQEHLTHAQANPTHAKENQTHVQALPTHVFVQAGVGGLAAAMAEGLQDLLSADPLSDPGKVLVVEPESAACVAQALVAGYPVRIPGSLRTSAEMLSCGLASASALEILQRHWKRHSVSSVLLSEEQLQAAPEILREAGGPKTTPSGAAGLAGSLHVAACDRLRVEHGLRPDSNVLFVVTEGVS